MTWAVTLDFHDTLARCDEWFDLEVHNLIPAFFEWQRATTGNAPEPREVEQGKHHYRRLRRRVLDTGIEVDAAAAVAEVLDFLKLSAPSAAIEGALTDIFKASLKTAEPLPGVVDAVQALWAAHVPLAVVSSAAYHPFLEWTLRKFELASCFEHVLTSASTGHYKSTTRIYETALNVLAVEASNCIHIGDSERFDVRPARAVGLRTVLVDDRMPESDADLVVPSLEDLPAALHRTFGLPLAV